MGPIDLDFIGGLGAGKMSSRRFVEIGDSFNALSEADWWAFEGHGAVRASAPMRLAEWLVITPQAALTYVYLNEQGYEEGGGGAAIDYESDSVGSQRLWGDVGLEFSGRLHMGARTIIAPRLYAGYRANLIDEEAERTFRVLSTGDEFTLTDEGLGDGGALVGIGVDASNGYSTFTLGYEGEFGDQIERHSLNASVRFRF
jgi:outer membrane autotransporter protein